MTSLTKSYSLQQRRKPNSHTKLPKIEQNLISSEKKLYTNQFEQDSKLLHSGTPTSQIQSLYNKRGNSININNGNKTSTLQLQPNKSKNSQNKSVIKLKPIIKEMNLEELKIQKDTKQKIVIETTGITDSKTDSAGSSRTSLHPIVNQIQGLISDETKNLILSVKSFNQNLVGQVSSIWWCVVDSLFISLQKIIKIKPTQVSLEKQGKSIQKSKQKQKQKQSPSKDKPRKQGSQKNTKKITGIIESNTKASIQLSRVYSCLQLQTVSNQQTVLRYYEDPSHVSLILESFFYQKAIVYLLGTIRKWNHHEEHLLIHSLALEIIPCIVECRKLIIDILMEAVENQQQDNKIRKPKYIAREKKLIQISKFTTMMKNQYEKYLNSLGSPHRYKNFCYPENLKEHAMLVVLQQKWRNIVFDTPIPPFLTTLESHKEYLLILQPLNLLYKYNKKQQSLQIYPYAEQFLKSLNTVFDIVLFTNADKDSSLLNFLGILDKAEILGILDRHYMGYFNAKPRKDINKMGGGYAKNKILVLDDKNNAKYYAGCQHALFLVEGSHAESKIARVNGRLVRMDDHDQGYLVNLGDKILNCARKGGHWDEILVEKNQRRK